MTGTGGMNIRAAIFLHTTHCQDLFYRVIQFHENNRYGIQNKEHCCLNNQGEVTQKVSQQAWSNGSHIGRIWAQCPNRTNMGPILEL